MHIRTVEKYHLLWAKLKASKIVAFEANMELLRISHKSNTNLYLRYYIATAVALKTFYKQQGWVPLC